MAGEDNAFTSQDATAYFQRVAKDRLELVMEMEADRMINLRLLEESDVLTERKVILEERRSRVDNNPSSILSEQMTAGLYQSHIPMELRSSAGSTRSPRSAPKDATDFYKLYYAPNNAILVIAGDVTAEEVKKLAKKTYGKIKPRAERVRRAAPAASPGTPPRCVSSLKIRGRGARPTQRFYLAPSYKTAELRRSGGPRIC